MYASKWEVASKSARLKRKITYNNPFTRDLTGPLISSVDSSDTPSKYVDRNPRLRRVRSSRLLISGNHITRPASRAESVPGGVTNGGNNEFLGGAVWKSDACRCERANKSRRKRRRCAPARGRKSRASFHSINFPNDPDWIYRQVGRNQLPLRIPHPTPLSERDSTKTNREVSRACKPGRERGHPF